MWGEAGSPTALQGPWAVLRLRDVLRGLGRGVQRYGVVRRLKRRLHGARRENE